MSGPGLRGKRNHFLIAIAAILLLIMVGLSYRQWRQYAVSNTDASRAREVIQSVDRLFLALLDAETGQRGFLLTGEDKYLEPYNRAIQSIPDELAQLARLLAVRTGESVNVARLDGVVDEKLSELRETISLRQTHGITPAHDVVLSPKDLAQAVVKVRTDNRT